jgi:competence protein ComFC
MNGPGQSSRLQNWLNAGLSLLYPEVCQLCQNERATPLDGFVGSLCQSQVRFIEPPFCARCGLPYGGEFTGPFECANCRELDFHFAFARSAAVAKTVVLEAIHRFKYSRSWWFENFLAGLLIRQAAPVLRAQPWDCLVPVPLHPLKQREREFNQSALLARQLSRATAIPCEEKLLRRVAATATQTHLNRPARMQNMKNAFAVTPAVNVRRRRILLVDDVFTTGATTNDCARALRDAGVEEVGVWTVARGL